MMDYLDWFPGRVAELRGQKNVSARDMSLSLGQSESYINKIENRHIFPSMAGFFYICDYLEITPQEFFDVEVQSPQTVRELYEALRRLTPAQAEHILQVVRDLGEKAE